MKLWLELLFCAMSPRGLYPSSAKVWVACWTYILDPEMLQGTKSGYFRYQPRHCWA